MGSTQEKARLYIPGLRVQKGGPNMISDTIFLVDPGSRPNCGGTCGIGCHNRVKLGKGKLVPPVQKSQKLRVKKGGTSIIADTICSVGPGSRPDYEGSCDRGYDCEVYTGKCKI